MTTKKTLPADSMAISEAIDLYDEAYRNIMTLQAMTEILRIAVAYGGAGDLDAPSFEFYCADMCDRVEKASSDLDVMYEAATGTKLTRESDKKDV